MNIGLTPQPALWPAQDRLYGAGETGVSRGSRSSLGGAKTYRGRAVYTPPFVCVSFFVVVLVMV
jgi:hypothetical protein